MRTVAAESPGWSRRRWGLTLVAVLVAQAGLIFWFGDNAPVVRRRARPEPRVSLAPNFPTALAALNDPTLFARANAYSFSGQAWQQLPRLEARPADWTEPPRELELQPEQLGALVRQLVESNTPPALPVATKPEPAIELPELPLAVSSLPARSELRVEGGLAGRELVSQFALTNWPSNDLLTNSVVRVVVDADGWTQSATLLASSGSAAADQLALDLAKSAQFESLRGTGPERLARTVPDVAWGNLIFRWHTLPLSATNTPAARP